jgi:hypothetical protein
MQILKCMSRQLALMRDDYITSVIKDVSSVLL